MKSSSSKKAWVLTASMGYGHMRAAYPLRDIAYEKIITANDSRILLKKEALLWSVLRGFYESISRFKSLPFIGNRLFGLYDRFQRISPLYPLRDLSKPTLGVLLLDFLISRGFQKSLIHFIKKKDVPVIATFFSLAIAAEKYGCKHVICVVTDSDINRIWVPKNPFSSKILYCAPTLRSAKRLEEYGVKKKNIFFTGFPLPKENVLFIEEDFSNRIRVLDSRNSYVKHKIIKKGRAVKRPLVLTFAVGGAGAQKDIGKDAILSLRQAILKEKVILHIVTGTHPELAEYYLSVIKDAQLTSVLSKNIYIHQSISYDLYFKEFNALLRKTDILWTKPSEMSFYCGLGIPLILTPPVGYHEHLNEEWLIRRGFAVKQDTPLFVKDWLFEWLEEGIFAKIAWNGFLEAKRDGTSEIISLVDSFIKKTKKKK